VRNFSLFLYLMTGPLLYLIACQARRLPWLGAILAVGCAAALAWATRLGWLFWLTHYDWLFMPAIVLHLLAGLVLLVKRSGSSVIAWPTGWRTALVFTAVLMAAAGVSGMWERSLLSLHHVASYSPFLGDNSPTVRSPRHLLASLRPVTTESWELKKTNASFADYPITVTDNASVPPPAALVRWAKKSLPADAVVASNGMNAYPLSVFMPQRLIAWPPIVSFNLSYPKALSPAYYELLGHAAQQHRAQPFFNTDETPEEQAEFLERTHPTHIVLDPPTYRELNRRLDGMPGQFDKVYDDGSWSVFAVRLN